MKAPQSIWHLTDLQGADCQDIVFSHADLIGSNLTDANFKGANLYQTRMDLTQKDGAKFDLNAFISTSSPNKDYAAFVMANS
ncbi:MAG: pentapeptide repeat-containing protein [Polynucleobacter sp.]|nr:pentapeptide repeat-containing protein [Polynucleobacter sp.]